MDCQDVNFDHHQHYLNTRRMARERAAQSNPKSRMTASEMAQKLTLRLAKYGITVTALSESPHTPSTGVIMIPRGTRKES